MALDMALVRSLDWISKQFVSDKENTLVKEAPKFIVHSLYGGKKV
jgi:hypothetical protein